MIPLGKSGELVAIKQLVLTRKRRGTVLQLVYDIPLAGHMSKEKTYYRDYCISTRCGIFFEPVNSAEKLP